MPECSKPDTLNALFSYTGLYFRKEINLILLGPWTNDILPIEGVVILYNSSLGSGPLLWEELQGLHLQGVGKHPSRICCHYFFAQIACPFWMHSDIESDIYNASGLCEFYGTEN